MEKGGVGDAMFVESVKGFVKLHLDCLHMLFSNAILREQAVHG